MQLSPSAVQKANLAAAIDSQPINIYLGWQIFLSRVFRERTDKGLWLHWYHPADRDRHLAVRYGYFVAPDQTLEEALHAAYQSIEAIVELESMEPFVSVASPDDYSKRHWEAVSADA